jgi:hypothetical protein
MYTPQNFFEIRETRINLTPLSEKQYENDDYHQEGTTEGGIEGKDSSGSKRIVYAKGV